MHKRPGLCEKSERGGELQWPEMREGIAEVSTAEDGGGCPRLDDVTDGIIRPSSGLVGATGRGPGLRKLL